MPIKIQDIIKTTRSLEGKNKRLNKLRELIQLLYLECLQKNGFFKKFAFVGGTCLRLCKGLSRFSEDLDFNYVGRKKLSQESLVKYIENANQVMIARGFHIKMGIPKSRPPLWSCFLKFEKILQECEISNHLNESLQIKIESDCSLFKSFEAELAYATDPQQEIVVENILKGTDSTLFGGKVHAFLFRPYLKGRDLYDLAWYLRKKIPLNVELIAETETHLGRKFKKNEKEIFDMIIEKIETIDFEKMKREIELFVEDRESLDQVFKKEFFLFLLRR